LCDFMTPVLRNACLLNSRVADLNCSVGTAGHPIQSDRETWLVEVAATTRERERC